MRVVSYLGNTNCKGILRFKIRDGKQLRVNIGGGTRLVVNINNTVRGKTVPVYIQIIVVFDFVLNVGGTEQNRRKAEL